MPKVRLTDLTVRNLAPPAEGQVDYWCDQLAGFGLRVSQGGARSFVVKTGNRRYTLGRWPTVSLQKARAEARRRLAKGTLGIEQPKTYAFNQALEEYLAVYVNKELKASTAYEKERLLRKEVVPHFRGRSLQSITKQDIVAITDALSGRSTTAIHVHKAMRAFFQWCAGRDMLERSPCENLRPPGRITSRARILSDDEMGKIYRAALKLARAGPASSMPNQFGFVCLIGIHTGMRRGEVGQLRWDWITPEVITLPKTVTKNGHEHTLPNLINENLGQIAKVRRADGEVSELLFPTSAGTSFSAWSDGKEALDAMCGVSNFVLHDFRRYLSTTMAKLGVAIDTTEAILNHITGSRSQIQRVYDRHDRLPEMREALERYEKHLVGIVS